VELRIMTLPELPLPTFQMMAGKPLTTAA